MFDFAINPPKNKKRKYFMGIPAEELKNYGSKEEAVAATIISKDNEQKLEEQKVTDNEIV